MRLPQLDGVIFDADGTLFDTERLAYTVWTAVSREMNAPYIPQHYMELVGRNHHGIVAALQQICPPDFPLDDFLTLCSQRCRAKLIQEGVPLKKGAREILEFLHQRNIPVALATSSGAQTTRLKLEDAHFTSYFHAVITGDMVTHSKPDPEIYRLACQALHLDPTRTLGVEDSKNGILSAHAAGMYPVMIPDLIPPPSEVESLLFRTFHSLLDLRDFLTQIFKA